MSLIKPNDFLKTASPADSLIDINDAILYVNVKGSMSMYTDEVTHHHAFHWL